MAHSFLLEVGVEEMPAHVVTPSVKQLVARISEYLADQRIEFETIKEFATPRRLAVIITGLSDKQPDIDEEVKGPAKKIAQDDEGNWSKAAIGFTRGQGVTVDDITFKELKGTEYVYVSKHVSGQPVADILAGLDKVIMAMNFPTMMKWGTNKFEFVRPIKWLVALLDDQVVPFSILDVATGKVSQGHRFLGHTVEFDQLDEYEPKLDSQFVIADQAKRKTVIREQIQQIADRQGWTVEIDEDLLEEVNNLVEWPTAFSGKFDEQYLVLPDEVLITSMKDHQRFFYARNANGELLPNFISVRNGNAEYLDNVIRGNERVLTARLEDANFFYQEDQQVAIADYVERLKNVAFHDKIGSMYAKMQRVTVLADLIADKLGLDDTAKQDLHRASQIYKFDLTTGMVGEFAELQGVMGEKYALLQGENATVATAIREHYMPISADGDLPATQVGAVLAIADKFDSVASFFATGMIPSGSNDPYALRRQTFGIVRILADRDWHLDLLGIEPELVDRLVAAKIAPEFDIQEQTQNIKDFFGDRIRQWFDHRNIRRDIVETAVEGNQIDVANIITAAKTIDAHKNDADFKENIEALTRVLRIADQNDGTGELVVDEGLFQNPSEQKLYTAVSEIEGQVLHQTIATSFEQLTSLKPIIEEYFDENMIMDKDEQIKNNRLHLLARLARIINGIGNLNDLLVK